MTFILSGGHLTPLIAFIEYAQIRGDKILMVVGNESCSSVEQLNIKKLSIPYFKILDTKYNRNHPWTIFINLINLILETYRLYQHLSKTINNSTKVNFIGFGSGASLPVGFVAKLTKSKLYLHEQTSVLGVANRILAPLATRLAISLPITKYAPKTAILTYNLLRNEIINPPSNTPFLVNSKPILFITGGHLGAESLNRIIEKHISKLTTDYQIFWQYGNSSWVSKYQSICTVKNWFSSQEMSWLIKNAAVVVARSGGNTVAELIYHKTKTITVPLPNSANGEQDLNADFLVSFGYAIKISQDDPDLNLIASIDNLKKLKPKLNLPMPNGTINFYKLTHD